MGGLLTVGRVPQIIMDVPWQFLTVLNVIVILIGFWKLEDCGWTYKPAEKTRQWHQSHVWTAKDTLWVAVVLFLIALAFSYASEDVLSVGDTSVMSHPNITMDDLDIRKLSPKPMRLPGH